MPRVFAVGHAPVVATETGPDDRRVIDACRTPAPGVMTVLTGRGGQYVSGIFALGDTAVMTTDTIAGDTYMIVAGARPGDRVVTVVAGIRTHHVPAIFTLGDNAVVTALATSDHGDMVDSKHIGPYRGRMANLAFTDDPYMPAARGTGFYPTGQRMASGALSRRTDKNALYVTGFATHQGVFEIQRKARVVMIEIGTDLERNGATCIESAQDQQGHQSRQSRTKVQQSWSG